MKVCIKMFGLALSTLISIGGLSGCSSHDAATTANADTRNEREEKPDEHSQHGETGTAGHHGVEPAKHDHPNPHGPASHGQQGHISKSHDHETHDHQAHDHQAHGQHVGEHKHGEHRHAGVAPKAAVKVGDQVPDFAMRTLEGKIVKLSELQRDERRTAEGVVVLSFWCSTCHSCRDVEHLLAKLVKEYEGQAAVMALDANSNETAARVAAFVKENDLALPVVLDPQGHTADLFGVSKTTTTVVIDGSGVLRYCGQFRHKGGGSAEEALQAVLAGKEVAVKATQQYG